MRWEDERYVRVYIRDTVEWDMLPWQSKALWPLLLRKVDRAGLLELGKHGARGLAVTVKLPIEVVEPGLVGLLEDGCVELRDTTLVVPNFIEAQETPSSDALRAKEYRARRREEARDGVVTKRDEAVTERDETVTKGDATVTTRHTPSHAVTDRHSVPIRTVPKEIPDSPSAPRDALDFEALYAKYPRKEGKKKGLQRFKSQITSRLKYDALTRALENYVATLTDVTFAKHFDTFMGCWEDYVDAGLLTPRQVTPAATSRRYEDLGAIADRIGGNT